MRARARTHAACVVSRARASCCRVARPASPRGPHSCDAFDDRDTMAPLCTQGALFADTFCDRDARSPHCAPLSSHHAPQSNTRSNIMANIVTLLTIGTSTSVPIVKSVTQMPYFRARRTQSLLRNVRGIAPRKQDDQTRGETPRAEARRPGKRRDTARRKAAPACQSTCGRSPMCENAPLPGLSAYQLDWTMPAARAEKLAAAAAT